MNAPSRRLLRGNLSAWALAHPSIVLFCMIAAMIGGLLSYQAIGRAEDPSFTWKSLTIRTEWPGANAREVEQLVTEPIEKKLEELPWFDFDRSYSRPGESVIILQLQDSIPPALVSDLWYQVRKKIGDIQGSLPSDINGPHVNDEFGDVYSFIYALTGDDFSPAEKKDVAEDVRRRLLDIAGIEKIDLLGVQPERIYVEVSARRLAAQGLTPSAVADAIQDDNAVAAAGRIDTDTDRVFLRVDTGLDSVDAIGAIPLSSGDRQVRLADVADVRRGYADPMIEAMRFNGRDAVGLGIVMAKGGNVVALGRTLEAEIEALRAALPAGLEIGTVADQASVVRFSINEFLKLLGEALVIVIGVGFVALGWRMGFVVALTVPLVLALTLVAMQILGIDLHRISLGALIIALGLLVDDAIIAVEMIAVKIAEGWQRLDAAAFAYTSTAFPMLSGTVVTAAGFIPIGFARSSSGEYTNAIFWVVAASLLISWVVAVIFTPYIGYHLLPRDGRIRHRDVHSTRLYHVLRACIEGCARAKWLTILLTLAMLGIAIYSFKLVPRQFFPSSSRVELVVDIRLAEGSSFAATAAEARRMEAFLSSDPAVESFVTYTGVGSPRFFLTLDAQLRNANLAQFVVTTKSFADREMLAHRIRTQAAERFPAARVRVSRLELGPPVGYPVQFRVLGDDPARLREIAYQVRDVMTAHPNLMNVNLDWDELAKRVRVVVDPSKAQALGLSKSQLSDALQILLSGRVATQYREDVEMIDVVVRARPEERLSLGDWRDLMIPLPGGSSVPLGQIATVAYEMEEPVLWRRSRETVMTVRADVTPGMQPPAVSDDVEKRFAPIVANLPEGYRIEVGGAAEASRKANNSLVKALPLMALAILGTLMIQLQSFARTLLVIGTAPLGMIGLVAALLVSGMPFGFVATLGTIALFGIIMRNAIILIDQIQQDVEGGIAPWDAVIGSTVRRARPIVLTAAAAMLGMLPLTTSAFWGPMAVAIMGGLASATLLTLFFLPALYVAVFRIRPAPVEERAAVRLPILTPEIPAE